MWDAQLPLVDGIARSASLRTCAPAPHRSNRCRPDQRAGACSDQPFGRLGRQLDGRSELLTTRAARAAVVRHSLRTPRLACGPRPRTSAYARSRHIWSAKASTAVRRGR